MALNQDADEIAKRYFPDRLWAEGSYPEVPEEMIGMMPQEMTYVLCREGIVNTWVTPCECFRLSDQEWIYTYRNAIAQPSLVSIQKHSQTHSIIAGVPSLNFIGYNHWVYVRHGMLYDPATARRYRQNSTLEIKEAILIW